VPTTVSYPGRCIVVAVAGDSFVVILAAVGDFDGFLTAVAAAAAAAAVVVSTAAGVALEANS